MTVQTCQIEGCNKPVQAKRLCTVHYNHDRAKRSPACIEPGCNKPQTARRLCSACYARHRRHGTAPPIKSQPAICTVADCNRPSKCCGLCPTHYYRLRSGESHPFRPIRSRISRPPGYRVYRITFTNGAVYFGITGDHAARPLTRLKCQPHGNMARLIKRGIMPTGIDWLTLHPKTPDGRLQANITRRSAVIQAGDKCINKQLRDC